MLSRLSCQLKPSSQILSNYAARKESMRIFRLINQESRSRSNPIFSRSSAQREPLREKILKPTTGSPFVTGQAAIAAASALGLGALCYYGAGLSKQAGALDRSMAWPQHVRDRIHSTYMYFGGGLAATAATAAAVLRNPRLMSLTSRNSFTSLMVSIAAMIGSGMIVQSIPYKPGFGTKQLAWLGHTAIIGTVMAPVALLGGPVMLKASLYCAGIISGLSAIAVTAPSDKFLTMGGPLAIGLGVVFASSIGTFFLPPTTVLGAGLYSLSIYGGLILFSGFLLYDTQRIIRNAETYPLYGYAPYDPINQSLSIYMDAINLFIRLAMILAGSGNRKR